MPDAPPDALTIDRRAPVRRVELDAGSWVDVVDGFVARPDEQFRRLRDDTPWTQTEVLRYDRYVPRSASAPMLREDVDPFLRQTGMHLAATYRVRWSGVAALLYRDGDDFQGFHSDREMRWLDDTLIAIVVLGVRRPFVLRRRGPTAQVVDRTPAGALDDDVVLTPGEGDMLVMGGAAQRDWLHTVPRADTPRPSHLADLAMDEQARPARHQPHVLRRPAVQRPATPAGISHSTVSAAGFEVRPIGTVESPLVDVSLAPNQGDEGAPDAVLVLDPELATAAQGHRSRRSDRRAHMAPPSSA